VPKATSTEDRFLGRILEAAKAHGEQSPPDEFGTHEVGDLQDVLRQCWNVMDAERRQAIADHWVVKDLLENWEPQ
jgi:hypothetical protein